MNRLYTNSTAHTVPRKYYYKKAYQHVISRTQVLRLCPNPFQPTTVLVILGKLNDIIKGSIVHTKISYVFATLLYYSRLIHMHVHILQFLIAFRISHNKFKIKHTLVSVLHIKWCLVMC